MKTYEVEFVVTERTVQRVLIEADSEAEAERIVSEYEFVNSWAWEVRSLEWSLDGVTVGGTVD